MTSLQDNIEKKKENCHFFDIHQLKINHVLWNTTKTTQACSRNKNISWQPITKEVIK